MLLSVPFDGPSCTVHMTDLKFLLFTLQDFCRCTQRLAKNVLLFCIKKCESLFLFFSPRVVDVVKQFFGGIIENLDFPLADTARIVHF